MQDAPLAMLLGATQDPALGTLGAVQVSQVPLEPHVRHPRLPTQHLPRHNRLWHSESALQFTPPLAKHPDPVKM